MPTYATADQIINAAAQELGLPPVSLSSAANDATGFQMLGLLNALGDELVRMKDWQFLEQIMEFTGDGTTTTFPLPDDYGRQINQTQWATKDNRPMRGPDSASVWSWSQYGIVSVGVYYRYRIIDNEYNVFPIPGAGEEFALYYISKNWVRDGTTIPPAPNIYKDRITNALDVPLFDRRLMITGLKLKFWAQKGFDTTQLAQEFNYVLEAEKGQNQGAREINLSGGDSYFLLNWANVPDGTYYGS